MLPLHARLAAHLPIHPLLLVRQCPHFSLQLCRVVSLRLARIPRAAPEPLARSIILLCLLSCLYGRLRCRLRVRAGFDSLCLALFLLRSLLPRLFLLFECWLVEAQLFEQFPVLRRLRSGRAGGGFHRGSSPWQYWLPSRARMQTAWPF